MVRLIFILLLSSLVACSSGKIIKDKTAYQSSVNTTIAESKKEIMNCEEIYAENADFSKMAEVKVTLSLLIKKDGTLTSADIAAQDITHHEVKECMLRKIQKLKFAKHDLGDEVEMNTVLTLKKLAHTHKGRGRTTFP